MKREFIFLKKTWPGLFSILFATCLVFLSSCNEQDTTATKSEGDTNTLALQPTTRKYYDLKLPVAELKTLLNTGNSREGQTVKILFQFTDEDLTTKAPYGLVGYGAKTNNDTTTMPVQLQNLSATWDTTGSCIMGNLELSRGKLGRILGRTTGQGPIPDNLLKDLYFYPHLREINGKNYLIYFISTSSTRPIIKLTDTGDATNPSPPDPPCTSTCDL